MTPDLLYCNREAWDSQFESQPEPIDEARRAAVARGCYDTGRVVIGLHYRKPPPPPSRSMELVQVLLIDPPQRGVLAWLRGVFA